MDLQLKHLLLFQRTWIWFKAPTQQLTTIWTGNGQPVGYGSVLSWVWGHPKGSCELEDLVLRWIAHMAPAAGTWPLLLPIGASSWDYLSIFTRCQAATSLASNEETVIESTFCYPVTVVTHHQCCLRVSTVYFQTLASGEIEHLHC